MYDWLTEVLADDAPQVVTANRRLARTLIEHFGRTQLDAGRGAWRRPNIHAFDDWLAKLVDSAGSELRLPLRINPQQSLVLWEHCLLEDIADPLMQVRGLARLCRDTWKRLHEWRLPLSECQNRAVGQDQRVFARAAGRYAEQLGENGWIDDATLPERLAELISDGQLQVPRRIAFVGFDRITPQADMVIGTAVASGSTKTLIEAETTGSARLSCYENSDAELRAAGAWARAELARDARLDIAIVVSKLEQDALHSARMLREGLAPGWQYGNERQRDALNVSFGRRLAEYPAIHTALLVLRWLHHDLHGAEVSQLLRSPFLGSGTVDGRARVELKLRDWPDRYWSRDLFLRATTAQRDDADDWLNRLASLDATLAEGSSRRRPSEWAALFDAVLRMFNWPGDETLSSTDFQLNNRWRDLLNEFSRIELVAATMPGDEAVSTLASMAGETVFQAEADSALVNVLGPLEAAGMQFDRLWVTGLAAADWPPAGRPMPLLSRDLQREYNMPDATPEDTAAYAKRVLERLRSSAEDVVFSYPLLIGDAAQAPTALLGDLSLTEVHCDPGWHAESFATSIPVTVAEDRVPPVAADEKVSGGAATIDRYLSDPFASFAHGRLGIRWMPQFKPGIAANIRGSLIHDALFELYQDKPSHAVISRWAEAEVAKRVERAIDAAFRPHERYADSVLLAMFALERRRTVALLRSVIDIDRKRTDFAVASVENEIHANVGGIRVDLRCDRIDRLPNDELAILDYKTGKTRRFLTGGEPGDMQLVVYACAIDDPIAGLGIFNVDSRHTSIDGAGPAFSGGDDWQESLRDWKREVRDVASRIAAGDVRLNVKQPSRYARPLSPLSRYAEVRRDSR